jgi:flagellar motor switch protein FliG
MSSSNKRTRVTPATAAAEKTQAATANFSAGNPKTEVPKTQNSQLSQKEKHIPLTGPQKAAAVIVSLGADKASRIYKYMDSEDVETLTLEVAKLGYLDSHQTEEVLGDFYELCLTNKAITEGGLEYARTVLEKAFGEQTANQLLEKVEKSMKNRQFAFLDKADAKSLFSALQYERPQTISLVLSYVSPAKSANVVEQLDPAKQVKVVENMAKMESPSPTAMKIIETEMGRRFSTIISSKHVKVGGIDFVASLMNNIDRTSEKSIFDGLSVYNQELAEEIRKRMFVFEDLVNMDDRSVQRFLRDCDPKDIVLSLKATTEDVANKLLSNMSTRMAQNIKDDLEITTNVRMKDVEEAQQRIVDVIRKLEEQNEIIIIKGGKDDIIA